MRASTFHPRRAALGVALLAWVIGARVAAPADPATTDDLAVLPATIDGVEPGRQLERRLVRLMERYDEARLARLSALHTRAELAAWQRERREFFLGQLARE